MAIEKPYHLSPYGLAHYLDSYTTRRVKKGQTILFQGEVPRYACVIKSGALKAYNIDPNGEEKIISLIGPDEIIAPSWVLGKSPVALYYYEVFDDCEFYVLPREELQQILKTNKDALLSAFDKVTSLFIGANFHINALEDSKSSQKLVSLLHYLSIRFGKRMPGNKVFINIRLTQHDIAHMLGLTRETVAMELSKLKKARVLSYKSQHYLIKPEELQRLHGEEDFNKVIM